MWMNQPCRRQRANHQLNSWRRRRQRYRYSYRHDRTPSTFKISTSTTWEEQFNLYVSHYRNLEENPVPASHRRQTYETWRHRRHPRRHRRFVAPAIGPMLSLRKTMFLEGKLKNSKTSFKGISSTTTTIWRCSRCSFWRWCPSTVRPWIISSRVKRTCSSTFHNSSTFRISSPFFATWRRRGPLRRLPD